MSFTAAQVIAIAKAEVGYCEKASNSQLDDKTANAGNKNYTKFARDLANVGYYNVNGLAWCACFAAWCYHKASGGKIKNTTTANAYGVPFNSYAGCPSCVSYYRNNNRFFKQPLPGDQIFFDNEHDGSSNHTGIVCQIKNNKVYTIEGNSNNRVSEREYALTDDTICGYGRPLYTGGTGDFLYDYDENFVANTEAVQEATKHNFFEIDLKASAETSAEFEVKAVKAASYTWKYQLIDLIQATKTPIKKLDTSKLKCISIDGLTPYTPYSLKIIAENDYLQSSQQVFFSTLQEKPGAIRDLAVTFNNALLEKKSCEVSFTPPKTWGECGISQNKGYRTSLIINGKVIAFSDTLIKYKKADKNVTKKIALTDFKLPDIDFTLNYTDIVQIGIQTWIKDSRSNKIILNSDYLQCSKPLYLCYQLKPVDNIYLNTLDKHKQVIFWHNT